MKVKVKLVFNSKFVVAQKMKMVRRGLDLLVIMRTMRMRRRRMKKNQRVERLACPT